MSDGAEKWLRAAGIRAAKTFAQTAVSMLTVGQAVLEVNWLNVLSVSATAAVISLLTSIAGLPEAPGGIKLNGDEAASPAERCGSTFETERNEIVKGPEEGEARE